MGFFMNANVTIALMLSACDNFDFIPFVSKALRIYLTTASLETVKQNHLHHHDPSRLMGNPNVSL